MKKSILLFVLKFNKKMIYLFFLQIIFSFVPFSFSAEALQEVWVKEGETLWGISQVYLKDPNRWPELLKYNSIVLKDPTSTLPGMKLKIPVMLIKDNLRKAYLVYLLNDVKVRKKDGFEWKKAYKNLELYNEDGIRTLSESQAQVRFYSGDILKIDENSLVVLRPELKVEEVQLMAGTLKASRTKIITPTTRITPATRDTIYKARIREDQATIVQVERGSAEVYGIQSGKKVQVPAGFANITLKNQSPSIPVPSPSLGDFQMPDFTSLGELKVVSDSDLKMKDNIILSPSKDRVFTDLSNGVSIEEESESAVPSLESQIQNTQYKSVKSWKYYRLQIARDSGFIYVVYDHKNNVEKQNSIHQLKDFNLPDGKYYRRISYFDEHQNETSFFKLPPFIVDTLPPKIVIYSPQESYRTTEGLVNIEGETDPNCFVTINNYPVSVQSDGKFNWSVVLVNEGANQIKITARDRSRNSTQLERTVFLSAQKR